MSEQGGKQQKAEEVFLAVSDLPSERWESGIVRMCNGDTELASEVRSLLGFHDKEDKFLDPNELMAQSLVFGRVRMAPDEELTPGTKIGVYTIRSLLGVGGMGSVYVAEQERPRRTVALKVIRRGLSTQSLLRRFEHEAEVLGRLQHPGIAQVFEAGAAPLVTPDGLSRDSQPFIAMELVRGLPLNKFCDHKDLDTKERLRLVARVCDAVHHAHQRGVIHRDLKPGNILVEDSGSPKILDFGVARAADVDMRVTTMQTSIGQLIGTLPYMSPEQVLGDPGEIDTRSDVYALGVIMYQLLTGRLPHDVASRSIPEAARVIREESPTKLSHVSRMFRGEIDTIVSKALDKDKRRRYQSAADLGDDIRRYLAGEPIHAKQDSALYVLRKQLKRYKWAAIAAGVALIALVAFTAYATVQARRERRLAAEANMERAFAFAAKDAAEVARQKEETARALADSASMRLAEQLEYARTERGRLEGVLGNIPLAEDSLWHQYFKHENASAPKWALREFFHRYPYEWSVQVSPNGLRCAAFAPQAGLFLLGANSGIGVYDASVGVSKRRITGLGSGVAILAVSADASRCFAALDNGRIVRVNLRGDAECALLTPYAPHLGAVRAIALSADGLLLATSGNDRTVRIWDTETLELKATWSAHPEVAMVLAFSPDSRALVTAPGPSSVQDLSARSHARVWRLSDLALLREYPVTARGGVTAAAFSQDNTTLVVATGQRQLNLYNLETSAVSSHEVTAGTSAVSSVSPLQGSGAQLLAIGDSVWEATVSGLRPLPSVGLQSQLLMSLGVVDDSVIIVCRDGLIRRIAVTPEYRRSRVADFDTWCFGTEFSPDGATLVVAGGNNEIRVVDAATLQTRHTFPIVERGIMRARAIRFIDGSDVFAAGCGDGAIRMCSAVSGRVLSVLPTGAPEIYSMERTPDGEFLVTGHADGTIRFFSIATCEYELLPVRLQRRVEGIAFTPDGSQMITSGLFGGIQIWDVRTRETVASVETSGIPWAVACSPDGSRLLVSTYDGVVDVFDSTYAFMTRLRAHRRLIPGLCFSQDGSLFATGSEDTTVRIWDAKTLRTLASLETDGGEVITVAFNPDASRLAASNASRFTTVYDFPRLDAYLTGNAAFQKRRADAQSAAPGAR
ncbi:MAG TPA: protein kinase [Phycisphaerales bacterium]|nr:protein kinase [Phycisphaerales bacterium]